MLGRLIGGFITILVGVTILPTIADEVRGGLCPGVGSNTTYCNTTGTNITGASNTVTGLITLFFALGVMSAGIAIAVGGLKDAGLM